MTKNILKVITIITVIVSLTAYHSYGQAKELPFSEDFESYTDSLDFWTNSGWTVIDADGDGENWYRHYDSVDDMHVMASNSWDDGALTPDNYLVTPQLTLPALEEGANIILQYDIAAGGGSFYDEKYKVVVSVAGNEEADFDAGTILFEEILTELESDWAFVKRSIDLSAFAGSDVYIAFVHFDSTDQDRLLLNNVSVEVVEHDLPFAENFNSYTDTQDFLTTSGWTTIDADGDDNNWFLEQIGGTNVMGSES